MKQESQFQHKWGWSAVPVFDNGTGTILIVAICSAGCGSIRTKVVLWQSRTPVQDNIDLPRFGCTDPMKDIV